jgi:hypothetical protein
VELDVITLAQTCNLQQDERVRVVGFGFRLCLVVENVFESQSMNVEAVSERVQFARFDVVGVYPGFTRRGECTVDIVVPLDCVCRVDNGLHVHGFSPPCDCCAIPRRPIPTMTAVIENARPGYAI